MLGINNIDTILLSASTEILLIYLICNCTCSLPLFITLKANFLQTLITVLDVIFVTMEHKTIHMGKFYRLG